MATFASLVVSLIARAEGLLPGFQKAQSYTDKLSAKMTNKFIGAAGAIMVVHRTLDAVADALEKANTEGAKFGDIMQQAATDALLAIPIAGDLGRIGIALRDMWTGDAEALRKLNVRLAEVQKRAAATQKAIDLMNKARATRLEAERGLAEALDPGNALLKAQNDIERIKEQYATLRAQAAAAVQDMQRLVKIMRELDMAEVEAIREARARFEHDKPSAIAARAAEDLIRQLRLQIDTFGMSATAAEIYRLKLEGVGDAQLKLLEALNKELELRQHQQMLDDRAKSWIERTMTPMERYMRALKELQELLDSNRLTQEQYARAVAWARKELEAMSEAQDKLRPAAIEQRFTAGFPGQGTRKENPFVDLKPIAQKELQLNVQQTKFQSEMVRTLRDIRDGQPQFEEGTL